MMDFLDKMIDRASVSGFGGEKDFSSSSRDLWIREWDEVRGQGELPRITRPYLQSTTVKAAIDRIARSLKSVPRKFFQGERELETGPEVQVFDSPNPNLDGDELIEGTAIYLETCGESVWGLDKFIGQIPGEIHLLNPENTVPILDADGMVTAWREERSIGGRRRTRTYPRNETIQFRYFNPYDEVRGLPTLTGGNLTVATDIYAKLQNVEFFRSAAVLSGILSTKQKVNDDVLNRALRRFLANKTGLGNSKKILALSGDWKFDPIQSTQKDMEFSRQQEMAREETASGYGVPPVELGILKFVNFATASIQRRMFWENRVVPLGRYIQGKVNRELFRRREIPTSFFLDFDDVEALRENFTEKLAWGKVLVEMGYPVNAINKALDLGMEDVAWGDDHLVNFNLVPARVVTSGGGGGGDDASRSRREGGVTSWADAVQRVERVIAEARARLRSSEVGRGDEGGEDGEDGDRPTEGGGATPGGFPVDRTFPRSLLRTEEARATYWKVADARTRKIEARFTKEIQRFLRDIRAEVIANLSRSEAVPKVMRAAKDRFGYPAPGEGEKDPLEDLVASTLTFEEGTAIARLVVIAKPHVRSAAEAGADALAADLGVATFPLNSPAAEAFFLSIESKIVGILPTLKREITETLAVGMRAGESLADLSTRVNNTFGVSTARARRISRTEIGKASNGGRFLGMEQEGVKRHEWLSARDGEVRDSHFAEDGEIVDVGDRFPNTGLHYPLDAEGDPSEVINCRCIALPEAGT